MKKNEGKKAIRKIYSSNASEKCLRQVYCGKISHLEMVTRFGGKENIKGK